MRRSNAVHEARGLIADRLLWWSWRLHLWARRIDNTIPPAAPPFARHLNVARPNETDLTALREKLERTYR